MPGVSMAKGLTMTCGPVHRPLDRECDPEDPSQRADPTELAEQWNVDEDVVQTLQRNVGAAEVDGLGVIVSLTANVSPTSGPRK